MHGFLRPAKRVPGQVSDIDLDFDITRRHDEDNIGGPTWTFGVIYHWSTDIDAVDYSKRHLPNVGFGVSY